MTISNGSNSFLTIARSLLVFLLETIRKPFLLFVFTYFAYFSFIVINDHIPISHYLPLKLMTPLKILFDYVIGTIKFIVIFWSGLNILKIGRKRLLTWLLINDQNLLYSISKAIENSLQAVAILLLFNAVIPVLNLSHNISTYLGKFTHVILIVTVAWIFLQSVNVIEKIVLLKITDNGDSFSMRKTNTQVLILKRIVLIIAAIIFIGAILMMFDSVRNFGEGLLTTAGVIGAVGAFSGQKTLGKLFSGLHIAFTQPVRIGDTVVIDNEVGEVEEISLSYITIKLWNLRRLILPIDYIIQNGILNLTKKPNELIGTIFIYADYTLPIAEVRKEFLTYLSQSLLWDRKASAFQVTELKEEVMEVRALVSASNATALWNLRCEIREKLLQFIVENYPHCLPVKRAINLSLT